jgi:PAS domain S-box-containing protein
MSGEAMAPQDQLPVMLMDRGVATEAASQIALDIVHIVATVHPDQALEKIARRLVEWVPCDAAFLCGVPRAWAVAIMDALLEGSDMGIAAEVEILARFCQVDGVLTRQLERSILRIARQIGAGSRRREYEVHLRSRRRDIQRWHMVLRALPLVLLGKMLGVLVIGRIGQRFERDEVALVERLQTALVLAMGARYAIEAQMQSRRRQEHLEAVFNNTSDGILTVDGNYRVVELNRAVTELTGWDVNEALGHTCMEVIQCRDERSQVLCHTPRCPLYQVFTRRQPLPYCEVSFTPRTGKLKEVAASIALVHSNEGAKGVIIARDVTPLNTANRMRSNFISMVSHELRTPLNSINGFLEIVMEGHVGALSERQYEFLSYARSSTQQLMSLVEDVLFISKADTGQFELRYSTVELPSLVDQLMHNLEPLAQSAEVTLKCSIPEPFPKIEADALRLQQVLTNLLNNAIKFTPPQGEVRIEASYDAREALVCVADTGCGVPYEDQPHVFERFYQSDNASLVKHGGYGLGLAIAKLIVEQHGGRIWLESEPGQGAAFYFTLPLSHGREASDQNDC